MAAPDDRTEALVSHLNRAADFAGTTLFNADFLQSGDYVWLLALMLDELTRIRAAIEEMNERQRRTT